MAVNHAGHNHPATPAGRAACRKAGGATPNKAPVTKAKAKSLGKRMVEHAASDEVPTPKKIKGDTEQAWRVPLTAIPDGSSLLGMPAYVVEFIKLAWRSEWRVDVGPVWHKDGRRSIRVSTYRGEVTVRWTREGNGITSAVWSSDVDATDQLSSLNEGIRKLKGE
jgi:hypothetical protein